MPSNINNSDYLLKSGFSDINAKALNNVNSWDKILADPATTSDDAKLIHRFFKPYKISLLKFILNKDCYEKSTFLDDVTDKYEVAPSLRKIIDAPFEYKVPAYPDWFYIAFPDVVIWCMDGDGKQLLREKISGLTEEVVVEDGHFNASILESVIELYLKHNQNLLECQIYSGHEHLTITGSSTSTKDISSQELKHQNLIEHVGLLCKTLNENGIKARIRSTGVELEWKVNPRSPASTFLGSICGNKEAFMFLKRNGYIDKDVCWDCGAEPISKKNTFTDRHDSSIQYYICDSCYTKGKITQATGGKNSNCYIATVCYGDSNASEVQLLRKFRDEKLSHSSIGMAFINFYYRISPYVSKQLEGRTKLNTTIRRHVLDRIVKFIQ